ncbi:MAG: precorrin-6y C5,15-methyltransferase (decarboxylating) subunit CbiE [Lachnospiraceae bacterium]|nr:precorrin-6y C5,15-methyltransferase (decarboxylating) subunit CbiE [Lachnospiraceae bacterium]
MKHKVYIIGMGPGGTEYLTMKAVKIIADCPFLAGSSRILAGVGSVRRQDAELYPLKKIDECLEWIDEKQEQGDTAVLVSGDVHYYSLAGTIQRSSYLWNTVFISGISSYQLMAERIGITLEDVGLCSVHGRNESEGYVACEVAQHKKTMFLCSRDFLPERIGAALCKYGYGDLKVWVGSNLAMKDEQVICMEADQISVRSFSGMSVVYVENKNAKHIDAAYLKDRDFVRGKVPMTKEEVRVLLMQRLEIKPWECLWDLGAGTGSVSIEMARRAPFGHVYSVEYKEEAVRLIGENKARFQCRNLEIIQSRMKDCIGKLPEPDRVFLGGSEGELEIIVSYLKNLSKTVHFVMTAVTLETLAEAVTLLSENDTFQYMQVQIGKSRMVGSYHSTAVNHPIWILEVDL